MPAISTFFRWIRTHKEFQKQYARATEERSEAMAEEILDIADDSPNAIKGIDRSDNARVQAHRLRVETRKWLMAKMKPKKYGDKLDVTSGGEKVVPIMGGSSVHGNDSLSEDSKS
jgi:phage terminase small subunit